MLYLSNKFKLHSSILSIGANEDSVIILDSSYNLYELVDNNFIFAKKIYDFTPHHQFSKACAVSMKGFIAIGKPKSNICEILYLKNGNLEHITTLSWHKADIYNTRFSRDGRFLVTGGEDGKVFIFSLPDFNMINILPPRPDYISNVHFGKISSLIVYSSYDLANCVFDMRRNIIVGSFDTNAVVEDIVFFDDDKKIFFVCANGESGIYDIQNDTTSINQNYHSWLTRVGLTKDNNYAYIGARSKVLSYLDLSSNTPSFSLNLDYDDGISFMRVVKAKLHIGYSSGYLQIFDLSKYESDLQNAIDSGDFRKAQEISQNNIALKTQNIYIDCMNRAWNAEFSKAKEILQEDESQINAMINNLKVFFEDSAKRDEFEDFSKNLGIYKDFNDAVRQKDYTKAYKIADENTALKQTSEFEALEETYNKVFEMAKNLLLIDTEESINQAMAILKPFINILSKKETINVLIRNTARFKEADRLFKNKNFADYFKLAESLKAIKTTSNYKKALALGEQILATINELESKSNLDKALDLLNVLLKFIPFSKIALERKNYLLLKIEFLDLYNNKNFIEIYKNIKKYDVLKGSMEYIHLQNHFNEIFDFALSESSKGDSKSVYRTLEPYFNIAFWQNKIESIFNISYLNEISKHIDESSDINWLKTLELYCEMFKKNDELIKICSKDNNIAQILDKVEAIEKEKIEFIDSIIIKQ